MFCFVAYNFLSANEENIFHYEKGIKVTWNKNQFTTPMKKKWRTIENLVVSAVYSISNIKSAIDKSKYAW